PHLRRAVARAGHDATAIGTERRATDFAVVTHGETELGTRRNVPDLRGVIGRRGYDASAVGTERGCRDGRVVDEAPLRRRDLERAPKDECACGDVLRIVHGRARGEEDGAHAVTLLNERRFAQLA